MPTSASIKKTLNDYIKGGDNSENVITRLLELNLYIAPIKISHCDCIRWLTKELHLSEKSQIVNNFIYGIENSKPEYRAALPAYAVAKSLPQHEYHGKDVYCTICGAFKLQNIDLTITNCARFLYGSLKTMKPAELALFLELNNKLPSAAPVKTQKLTAIIKEIAISPPNETPSSLLIRLTKLKELKIPKDQIRGLLETFGYLGILQSPMNKGYLYKFTPPFTHPAKSSKSDWRYPLDFWKGADGVNLEALEYWFTDHPEITSIFNFKPSTQHDKH